MQTDEFRAGALHLVRGLSDAVTRWLLAGGDEKATLSWVSGACEQLRNQVQDDQSRHLIGLIDIAATNLLMQLGGFAPHERAGDENESPEVLLVKALWELEARLTRLSLVH